MAVFTYPPVSIDTTGLATEAKQDTIITEIQSSNSKLDDVNIELDAQSSTLTSIDGKDFATQTTLASLEAKDFATQTTLAALLVELALKADLTETQPVSLSSSPLPTGAATEATLADVDTKVGNLDARLAGALAPVEHDELEITYVAAGNGAGEVETVIYKLATATVATLTLSYNASNQLTGVVKS